MFWGAFLCLSVFHKYSKSNEQMEFFLLVGRLKKEVNNFEKDPSLIMHTKKKILNFQKHLSTEYMPSQSGHPYHNH